MCGDKQLFLVWTHSILMACNSYNWDPRMRNKQITVAALTGLVVGFFMTLAPLEEERPMTKGLHKPKYTNAPAGSF